MKKTACFCISICLQKLPYVRSILIVNELNGSSFQVSNQVVKSIHSGVTVLHLNITIPNQELLLICVLLFYRYNYLSYRTVECDS